MKSSKLFTQATIPSFNLSSSTEAIEPNARPTNRSRHLLRSGLESFSDRSLRFSERLHYQVTMAKKSCFSYANSSSGVMFRLRSERRGRSGFYALLRTKPEPAQAGYTRSEFQEILQQASVNGIRFPVGDDDSSPILETLSQADPTLSQIKRKQRRQS